MGRHLVKFQKYHGTGNDFIMIDDREIRFDVNDQKLVEEMCRRRFGIGADGLILLRDHDKYDFEMVYFNSDGRQSSMCGNGGRCIVAYANDLGVVDKKCSFLAIDGAHDGKVLPDGRISLKMNDVDQVEQVDDAYILDTGSPHYVALNKDPDIMDLISAARAVRYGARFKESGINVNFIKINEDQSINMRTYERGVEDETYSCGTGVVATAIVADMLSKNTKGTRKIFTKGGELEVTLIEKNGWYEDIWLIGPAEYVYSGEYAID